jgi:hypothetical protein
MHFHCKRVLLLRCNVVSNHKMYEVFVYSDRCFCPILTTFGVSRQIFVDIPDKQIYGNPSSRSRADESKETDRLNSLMPFYSLSWRFDFIGNSET